MAVILDKEKCNGCESCVQICPVDAIKIENGKGVVNDECVECASCVDECSNGAISLKE